MRFDIFSNANMYQQTFELHAKLIRALAHPRRLEIVHLLRGNTMPVTKIYNMLDLPQANVSQHLHILRQANIVQTEKRGKQIYYRLAHQNFIKVCDLMREMLIEHVKNTALADEFALSMNDLVPIVSDPVCGMRLSPKTASFALETDGQRYYFCASGCLNTFQKRHQKHQQKRSVHAHHTH